VTRKPEYNAWVIKSLTQRVARHNEAQADPARRLKLADVKAVHGSGYRTPEQALEKVDAYVEALLKADDFDEWKHKRDLRGRFSPKAGAGKIEHQRRMQDDEEYRAAHTQVIPETRFSTLGPPAGALAGAALGAAAWSNPGTKGQVDRATRRVAAFTAGKGAKIAVGVPLFMAAAAARPLAGRAALAMGRKPPSRADYARVVRSVANAAERAGAKGVERTLAVADRVRDRVLVAARRTGGPWAVRLAGAAVPGALYGTGLYQGMKFAGPILDSLFPRRVEKARDGTGLAKFDESKHARDDRGRFAAKAALGAAAGSVAGAAAVHLAGPAAASAWLNRRTRQHLARAAEASRKREYVREMRIDLAERNDRVRAATSPVAMRLRQTERDLERQFPRTSRLIDTGERVTRLIDENLGAQAETRPVLARLTYRANVNSEAAQGTADRLVYSAQRLREALLTGKLVPDHELPRSGSPSATNIVRGRGPDDLARPRYEQAARQRLTEEAQAAISARARALRTLASSRAEETLRMTQDRTYRAAARQRQRLAAGLRSPRARVAAALVGALAGGTITALSVGRSRELGALKADLTLALRKTMGEPDGVEELAKASAPSAATMRNVTQMAIDRFRSRIGSAALAQGQRRLRAALVGPKARALAIGGAAAAGGAAGGSLGYVAQGGAGNPYRDKEGRFTSREKAAFVVGMVGGAAAAAAMAVGLRRGNTVAAQKVLGEVRARAGKTLDRFERSMRRRLTTEAQKKGIQMPATKLDRRADFPDLMDRAQVSFPARRMTMAQAEQKVKERFSQVMADAADPETWFGLQVDRSLQAQRRTLALHAAKQNWSATAKAKAEKVLTDLAAANKQRVRETLARHAERGQQLEAATNELSAFRSAVMAARKIERAPEIPSATGAVRALKGDAEDTVRRYFSLRDQMSEVSQVADTLPGAIDDQARAAAIGSRKKITTALSAAEKKFTALIDDLDTGAKRAAQEYSQWKSGGLPPLVDDLVTQGPALRGQVAGTTSRLRPPPPSDQLARARDTLLGDVRAMFTSESARRASAAKQEAAREVGAALERLQAMGPRQLPSGAGRALERMALAVGRARADLMEDLRKVPGALEVGLGPRAMDNLRAVSAWAQRTGASIRSGAAGLVNDDKGKFSWPKALRVPALLSSLGILKFADDEMLPQWGDRVRRPLPGNKDRVFDLDAQGNGQFGFTYTDPEGKRRWLAGYQIRDGREVKLPLGAEYAPRQQQQQQNQQALGMRRGDQQIVQIKDDNQRRQLDQAYGKARGTGAIIRLADDVSVLKNDAVEELKGAGRIAFQARRNALGGFRRDKDGALDASSMARGLGMLFEDRDAQMLTAGQMRTLLLGGQNAGGGNTPGLYSPSGDRSSKGIASTIEADFKRVAPGGADLKNWTRATRVLQNTGALEDGDADRLRSLIGGGAQAVAARPSSTPAGAAASTAPRPAADLNMQALRSRALNIYDRGEKLAEERGRTSNIARAWGRDVSMFAIDPEPGKSTREAYADVLAEVMRDRYAALRARKPDLSESDLLREVQREMTADLDETGRLTVSRLVSKVDVGGALAKFDEAKIARHARGTTGGQGGEFAPKMAGEAAGAVAQTAKPNRGAAERSAAEPVRALGALGEVGASTAAWQAASRFLPPAARVGGRVGQFGVKLAASAAAGAAGKAGGEAVAGQGYKAVGRTPPPSYEPPLRGATEEGIRLAGSILGTMGGGALGAGAGPVGAWAGGTVGAVAGEEAAATLHRFVTSRMGTDAAARVQRYFQP
jgi:hypothetical protein